jgi:hypothetical protein
LLYLTHVRFFFIISFLSLSVLLFEFPLFFQIIESNLILPTNYPIDFTFHHHNGKSKSQIDYILFKRKTLNLQPRVSIIPFDAINTSDHTAFSAAVRISLIFPNPVCFFSLFRCLVDVAIPYSSTYRFECL